MYLLKCFIAQAVLFLAFCSTLWSQSAPKDWMLADPATDKLAGTSTTKAYNELLKGKKSSTIIVAVIDNGTDVEHPDLKDIIWTNPKEIAGNGIDDDHNGYADDIHGWDFIGGKNGNVDKDNLEITREYKRLAVKFGNAKVATEADAKDFKEWQDLKTKYEARSKGARDQYNQMAYIMKGLAAIQKATGEQSPGPNSIKNIDGHGNDTMTLYKAIFTQLIKANKGLDTTKWADQFKDYYKETETRYKYQYDTAFDTRYIVGDNYADVTQKYYGNNDVSHPTPMHGTHVAGIIGAIRGNNTGIDGIADNVRIIVVRVVPDGDERDKDVANAIRYAVDNGAKVVNMSFGKSYSPYKYLVDAAVKYAAEHDVLLVHAAGNDAKNIDVANNFPSPYLLDGSHPSNWIEVGAIDQNFDRASFSNYGKKNVDIFAPGVNIYSTTPNNSYAFESGTSMASPVCAGVAAVIRSYYPQLTATQVKQILVSTVYKPTAKVHIPAKVKAKRKSDNDADESDEGPKSKTVKLSKICQSGGIANLYNALKMAETINKK